MKCKWCEIELQEDEHSMFCINQECKLKYIDQKEEKENSQKSLVDF